MINKGVSPELIRRENRHLESSSSTSTSSSSSSISAKKHKKEIYRREYQDDDDVMECSGRGCKSCTTGTIADCVAVCFCPCAVVNFLALALVKVPWTIGKKCLGIGNKKKEKRVQMKAKMMAFNAENVPVSGELMSVGMGQEEEEDDRSGETDVDMVWMEMGQLGFGRVSFHGFQSFGGNSSNVVHNM